MLEQEPAVDEIVGSRVAPLIDVAGSELDVGDAPLLRGVAGQVELDLVHVESDHVPGRAGQPSELERDLSASAPEIEAAGVGREPNVLEQVDRVAAPRPGEELKPLVPFATSANDVLGHYEAVRACGRSARRYSRV